MKEFKDKVAVVTGAASGIGWGIAEHCAEEGMKVVLADVDEPTLKEAGNTLKNRGTDVVTVLTDVSRFSDVENLAQKTLDAFGCVHLLFNNAGVHSQDPIWESSLKDWEWTIGVNLWGVIHGIKAFVPIMIKQQTECHIVNSASLSGLIAGALEGAYRVTKHGVVSLSETLYIELKLARMKIGVSVLCPGFVRTRILENAQIRPEEFKSPPDQCEMTPEKQVSAKMINEYYQNGIQSGMPPGECAALVFEAIRGDRFYIITHPIESCRQIQQRMENIIQDRNPTVPELPPDMYKYSRFLK
jgi:NAD(P)-dependent dehydrogenase (short-subunit alcohol dehydrogenase family)